MLTRQAYIVLRIAVESVAHGNLQTRIAHLKIDDQMVSFCVKKEEDKGDGGNRRRYTYLNLIKYNRLHKTQSCLGNECSRQLQTKHAHSSLLLKFIFVISDNQGTC